MMRINKFLSMHGIASRRTIDKLIASGKVKVNGAVASLGEEVSESDTFIVDGKKVVVNKPVNFEYYLLNKPLSVLCTLKDEQRGRRKVTDIVKSKERIYPVGRLDYMTEGLIILTNDGEVVNKLLHPSKEVWKRYYCIVDRPIHEEFLSKWRKGIVLDDGPTLPAKVTRDSKRKDAIYIEIAEGRNRQIRRMMGYFQLKVSYLQRVRVGEIELESSLEVGKYRKLTQKEIAYLRSL